MAAVLDINILCNKMLELNTLMPLLHKYEASIDTINSIDNWKWENERTVVSVKQIATILDMQHIVIIKLKHPKIKDIGIYIEKCDNQYLYNLWINIAGYSMLDFEKITADNKKLYQKIVQEILEYNRHIKNFFEIVGIGVETTVSYEKNPIDIIRNSENVLLWIVNKHVELDVQIENFEEKHVRGICILQKRVLEKNKYPVYNLLRKVFGVETSDCPQ